MKKIIITLCFLISSALAEIDWDFYEGAFDTAKEDDKVVLIMFSMVGCKVCAYMKEKVYTDKAVQEYMDENFVAVEIDIYDNPDKKKFQVLGTPSYFFLNAKGENIVPKMVGGAKAADFLLKLKSVMKQFKAR